MKTRCAGTFALGFALAEAVRVETGDDELSTLNSSAAFWAHHGKRSGSRLSCDLDEGLSTGEYTLEECVTAGEDREFWKARRVTVDDSSGQDETVGVIIDTDSDDFLSECLFGQLLSSRDPEHFVDCLAIGAATHGASAYNYLITKPLQGKFYAVDGLEPFPFGFVPKRLFPLVSIWMQLADATAAMCRTKGANAVKFFPWDYEWITNMGGGMAGGSDEPSVKLLSHGSAEVCCSEEELGGCKASLRPGTGVTEQLPLPKTVPACNVQEHAHAARRSASKFGKLAFLVLDRKAMWKAFPKVTSDPQENDLLVKNLSEYLLPGIAEDLSKADETAVGVFNEVVKVMLELTLMWYDPFKKKILIDYDKVQTLKTCIPDSLGGKIHDLYTLLKPN